MPSILFIAAFLLLVYVVRFIGRHPGNQRFF